MKFEEWEPVYEAILTDFDFDRCADEEARDVLATLTHPFSHDALNRLQGCTVGIAGGAGSLGDELHRLDAVDIVIAASNAATVLRDAGLPVDCHVTDLDKTPATAVRVSNEEIPVVILAHGDNLALIEEWVPQCRADWVVATTQAEPRGHVTNYGGFTDGDRAAFLADSFGASRMVFVGWEFDDPSVGPVKQRKLQWAERLLYWLEVRRGEAFDVLAGRRAGIDTNVLPL